MNDILDPNHNEYLGDGVYASYDGYQVWLAVNHHANKVIALEADVYGNLKKYVEKIYQANVLFTTPVEGTSQ